MDKQTNRFYEFGPFRLDLTQRILLREGQHVPLTLKAYETLRVLVENSGRILEKEELLNQIWPDTFIEEATLAKNVSTLRKVLAEGDGTREYIETIPKRGYRFVAGVKEAENGEATLILQEHIKMQIVAEEVELPSEPAPLTSASKAVDTGSGQPAFLANGKPMVPVGQRNKARATSRAGYLVSRIKQHNRGMALLLVVGGIVFGLYWLIRQRQANPVTKPLPASPLQTMRMRKLTNTGNITTAAISADGTYVAYALQDAGQQSLWLRQVAITSNVQISPPARANYTGLTFSRDGNYLYYIIADFK